MNNYFRVLIVLLLMVITASCGKGNKSSTVVVESGGPVVMSSAISSSNHYLEVELLNSTTEAKLKDLSLTITDSEGGILPVENVSLSDNSSKLIIQTGTQVATQYKLYYKTLNASNKPSSNQKNKISARASIDATYDFIDFQGSIEPEPYIKSVIALDNTRILVTMSDLMDKASIEKTVGTEITDKITSAYRIVAADNGRPREDVGDVIVKAAELDPQDGTRIILTTSPLSDIEYFITIANVYSKPPSKLIHPLRNKLSFFGMVAEDVTPPSLVSAVSTGNTSAMLYFSEPLSDAADDPIKFILCTDEFVNGVCEGNTLTVTGAEFQAHNTLISLTTLPQQSGINYYVQVSNVNDQATPAPGNEIDPNPAYANFIGSGKGAPQVVSALAVSNKEIIVVFSERMNDDVLGNGDPNVIENIYRIDDPHLDVKSVAWQDKPRSVILTTTPQARIEYTVVVKNVQSAEGLLIDPENNSANFIGVAAKDEEKPKLLGAEAESSNTVRLYFSEGLSESASDPTNYTITIAVCPIDDTGCVVGAELAVDAAQQTALDSQVVLTTNPQQPRVEYTVLVDEAVTDKAMPLPHNKIDPNHNSANFGILLDDKEAPSITRAEAVNITEILISFDDSMGENAGDPANYIICAVTPVNGVCPEEFRLSVISAELSSTGSQVTLTTLPMADGTNYTVIVNPEVTDATGNKMNETDITTSFIYLGATTVADASKSPHVVGAISRSNTAVVVTFSSIMGSSARNPQNYVFTQENVNGEVGTLYITGVEWADDSHTAVEITTTAQNEVTYRVTVVNVKDYYGNPLDSKRESLSGVLYEPISAVFAGSPPTLLELVLTDDNWQLVYDKNNDDKPNAGDRIQVGDHVIVFANNTLSVDENGNEVISNWIDNDEEGQPGYGVLSAGDTITGMVDTDFDGLSDNEELRGVKIVILMSNGEPVYREITSDPTKADTDGDGLTDLEEWAYAMDPRSADTDSDGLSDYVEWNVVFSAPADQDSDDDGLQDGLEHTFYFTSPILADTDGDQLNDDVELLELNRDPRVADLPDLKINVTGVNLHLDERFTYVDASGQTVTQESSTNTSLTSSDNTSFASSQLTTKERSDSFGWNFDFGLRDAQTDDDALGGNEVTFFTNYIGSLFSRLFLEAGITGSWEDTKGTSIQIDRESARESQQAYENSLAKANEYSESSEVTRELVGARISASVNVENTGNVAMTVKNLEISVLTIDPMDHKQLKPIATLVSESSMLLGDSLEINLGPFNRSKGPFIFANDTLYPQLVESLMRDPTSLVFKVVNYDIIDEYDRNFAFANQVARDRTAGIIFDFGELGTEPHYAATSGFLDSGDNGNFYIGGFDDIGRVKGVPLGYLLESVLEIPKHNPALDIIEPGENGSLESIPDGDDYEDSGNIVAGANGILETIVAGDDQLRNPAITTGIIAGADKRVDTIAQGDDVQLVPYGTTGVAPKTLIVDPGTNGVLESLSMGDDTQEFINGYELRSTCSVNSSDKKRISEYCTVSGNGCSCDGPKGLFRVNTFRNGDYGNAWFVQFNGEVPAATDFDSIMIKPGQDMYLAFLQDLDKDGLFAHEEYLFGSTDSSVNVYDNSLFKPVIDPKSQRASALTPEELLKDNHQPDDFADSMDSDRDGIGDLAEAKLGWIINRDGVLKRVFSHPGLVDSDNDGLWDIQEQDLRGFCKENDWRKDALCRPVAVEQSEATGIIVGSNGRLDTLVSGDDEYALFIPKNADNDNMPDTDDPINRGFLFGTVAILPGKNGKIDTVLNQNSDDEYINAQTYLPATDPLLSDTDMDRVSDGDELFGYAAAISIVEGAETEGNQTINWGIANTRAVGDDVQRVYPGSQTTLGAVIISAGENGILETPPEGDDLETAFWFIAPGSDRTLDCVVSNAADSVQNYDDAATELDPYAPAIWNKTDGTLAPSLVDPNCYMNSLGEDTAGKDLKLFGKVVMTDPLRRDSEGDRVLDGFEVAIGSDPTIDDGSTFRDSDYDGLSDAEEQQGWLVKINGSTVGKLVRSNAALPDTDFDGLPDYVERDIGTDPTKRDTDGDGIYDYDEFRSVTRQVSFDANGDNQVDEKDTLTYSVYDYEYMANVFTGFNLVVNSDAHGTKPFDSDSDGDGLSDYAELVTGYRVVLTGDTSQGEIVLTNANNADSDGDGLSDYEEAIGKKFVRDNAGKFVLDANGNRIVAKDTAITNASKSDTDGDGRSDGVELSEGSLTDPLVEDTQITVSYDSLFASNLNECSMGLGDTTKTDGGDSIPDGAVTECEPTTNLLWWFYATGSDDGVTRKKRMLSSSDEFGYVPDGSVKPVAAGHTQIIDDDSLALLTTDNNNPDNSENPTSVSYTTGLKMSVGKCEDAVNDHENCLNNLYEIPKGATGYNSNAHIDWGSGGVFEYTGEVNPFLNFFFNLSALFDAALNEKFIVRWTGEVYFPVDGLYKFKTVVDDGVRMYIDHTADAGTSNILVKNADGSPVSDAEAWGPNSDREIYGDIQLNAGWHQITVDYFERTGQANNLLQWSQPTGVQDTNGDEIYTAYEAINADKYLRHSLGNGSYACIGIERNINQSSYISLGRSTSLETSIPPVATYEPGLPYYGSTKGSELNLFRMAVARSVNKDRYYVDLDSYPDGIGVKELVSTAMDLAASRGIIENLVRSDYDSSVVFEASYLKREDPNDSNSPRYFDLSDAGKLLYKQLESNSRFGQQTFVIRPKENVEISGILMKVNDIDKLVECPVGSPDVVVQFGASCTKRFTRSIDYNEAVQRGTFSMSLRDMQAETFSPNGSTIGCDIDVTTTISNK